MFRRNRAIVMGLAGLAGVLLSITATHAGPGCVTLFDNVHCPIGNAILTDIGGELEVSNLGPLGSDGVAIEHGETARFDIFPEVTNPLPGAFVQMNGFGTVDGLFGEPTGQIRHEFLDVPGPRAVTMMQTTPDFSAIGASTYTLQIWLNGQLQHEENNKTGVAVSSEPGPRTWCCWLIYYYERPFTPTNYTVTGSRVTVLGDEVCYIPENPTKTVNSFASLNMVAANVGSIIIKNEAESQDPPPGGHGVPTIGQWGLIILGLLLLAAGAIAIRRRVSTGDLAVLAT